MPKDSYVHMGCRWLKIQRFFVDGGRGKDLSVFGGSVVVLVVIVGGSKGSGFLLSYWLEHLSFGFQDLSAVSFQVSGAVGFSL